MDSKSLLDYALFQLTPTRTRCDLLVFSGGVTEKLASGLVGPFISHLKFAKDQIPKGGYSITLRPPSAHASWFTKATFQRFVRFVSTPEVLERFVHVEREIVQIGSSIQSNELSNIHIVGQGEDGSLSSTDRIVKKSTDSTKSKGEIERSDDVLQEENSKIRLQRHLEIRKVLLRKEQAMAYARALAAGFEMDNIDDLISFADTFGASRLREACIDFKELCKKKHTDGIWMDELAAMEACSQSELPYLGTSGIILTCESGASGQNNMLNFCSDGVSGGKLMPNGSLDMSSDSTTSQANSDSNKDNNLPASDQMPPNSATVQMQMPWPNQIPRFMYNIQSPVQQMPPYQGYHFPAMQPVPPYYQGNMCWPPNMDESSHGLLREPAYHQHQKSSSSKKDKPPNVKGPKTSEEDEQNESSDSDSGSDCDAHTPHDRKHSSMGQPYRKKNRKKSKTVVIRNINYITSKRRNEENGVSDDPSSVEDELIHEESLREKIEDAIGSLEKHHNSSSHNNKKRGGHKSLGIANRSDSSGDQDLGNDPVADISVGGKRNENWDAFQDILMKNKESITKQHPKNVCDEQFAIKSSDDGIGAGTSPAVDLEPEKIIMQRKLAADSFVEIGRDGGYDGRVNLEDFRNGENFCSSMKRRDCADEQLLFSQGLEESRSFQGKALSDCASELSIVKNGKGEDWFIVNHFGQSENQEAAIEQTTFGGNDTSSLEHDQSQTERREKSLPIDDSFMIQSRLAVDDQYDSQWKSDISMVSDLNVTSQPENGTPDVSQNKLALSGAYEPNDLCMVLEWDSRVECERASWTPEMDYGIEISFMEADKKSSAVETNDDAEENLPVKSKSINGKNAVGPGTTSVGKGLSKNPRGSLVKSNSDILSKSKKSSPINWSIVQKSKSEKEEEIRKKMEELVIQRQKRITEKTAASGFTPAKKVPVGSKVASSKHDKHRSQSTTQDSIRSSSPKLSSTNSAMDRLVPGQIKHKWASALSKSDQLKKTSSKLIRFWKQVHGEEKDLLETNKSSESSEKLREVKGLTVHNSCSVAGDFITMTELRKKILTFTDLIDLPSCIGSASLNELLIGTVKDLHKLYPDIICRISTSEMEGISTNQAVASFCDALRSIGDMWMKNNEWRANSLAILDDMINVARERLFDMMDEDDQTKDYSPQANAFGRALSDSYSDNKTPISSSPATPTWVLLEMTNCYTKVGEFEKNSYSPPLLLPLRVQAIGKLNPIDVKRLSFHMLPHIAAQDPNLLKQMNQTVEELKLKTQAKNDFEVRAADSIEVTKECKMTEDIVKILMFNLDKITGDKGRNQIGSLNIPPVTSRETLEGEAMDVLLPTPSLPNLQPSMVAAEAPPPPTSPRMSPKVELIPPPIISSNAIELPPSPLLSMVLPNAIVSSPPKLLPNAIAGPPPLPPPPLIASGNTTVMPPPTTSGNIAPPPPPPMTSGSTAAPPIMSSNGSAPSQPPPMPLTKAGAHPPPPALGGAKSLRAKKAATKLKRSPQMGNLYRLLKGKVEGSSLDGKSLQGGKKSKIGASTGGKQGMADALAEMTKRSIMEVKVSANSFQTTDMAELLKFHKYVESHLEKLTDESQVLARFEGFPMKKLEALRMAAAMYSKLDAMVNNLQNWKIEAPLGQLLDKAENYFNKIKGELDALEQTKDEESKKFQSHKIHFDFSILVRIKELMVDVSSGCMELALKERRGAKAKENAEFGSKIEGRKKGSAKMLWKAFQFAFRVYTFAGGHDDRADKLTRELAHEIESNPHH
ncbi:hypothetical protein F0562_018475 [Nyssa sinensis]|uniref:FH2 domain-containing protein n=1 Tax=Nyssa sinensis TaxID=561372 RepID=A0A5J4Z9R8_9ASTE|nr:hypothetical protein F0562_018475 [Nyssa sinensis]